MPIDEKAWLETRHEAIGLLISAAQARAIIEAYEAAKTPLTEHAKPDDHDPRGRMKAEALAGDETTKARIEATGNAQGEPDLAADTCQADCVQPSPAPTTEREECRAENATVAQETWAARTETGQPDDCRIAFESWYWKGDVAPPGTKEDDGDYVDFNASLAWDAWQAAWEATCPN